MNDRVATRSALLELRDERHAMREGFQFLDEKCLLLAGAMLGELIRYEALWQEYARLQAQAEDTLRAALARHGLEELAIYPLDPATGSGLTLQSSVRSIMGVALAEVSGSVDLPQVIDPLLRTPEAAACAQAHAALLLAGAQMAACATNLERLQHEYRRSSRRARALDSVLLPEIESDVEDMQLRLEEQERDEALSMRLQHRES